DDVNYQAPMQADVLDKALHVRAVAAANENQIDDVRVAAERLVHATSDIEGGCVRVRAVDVDRENGHGDFSTALALLLEGAGDAVEDGLRHGGTMSHLIGRR